MDDGGAKIEHMAKYFCDKLKLNLVSVCILKLEMAFFCG